jgi:hypothetical protein
MDDLCVESIGNGEEGGGWQKVEGMRQEVTSEAGD